MTSAFTTELRRLRRATRPREQRSALTAALVVAIIVILVASPQAQQPAPALAASASPSAGSMIAIDAPTDVDLLVGRSTVLNVGATIARVSLTVPDIADAMVTAPSQLLIHGKQPGTISLFVWDRAGAIKTFEVKVRRDLTPLVGHLKQLFPNEAITVMGSGKDVVISGTVSGQYVIDKAAEVAGGYVDKKENVVNLLKQQEGVASNQVMLRVRFAEVSRSALTELGASFFTGANGFHDYVARSTTQQFAAPDFAEMVRNSEQGPRPPTWGGGRDTVTSTGGRMDFSDFLNLFVFNNKYSIGTVVKALQERGLFQSLAEPNLVATNGKEASFLAGGEFPIPVVQGGQAGNSVTIIFKEFGVRLNFTPTVLGGDLINLKVRPEVSALDFNNAIVIEGFRVPALSTRRTETEVELQDGQTFAIAGLMNNTVQDSMRKIPGIGDIPILGWLFKSKAMQKAQTELVVMITPHIVRKGQNGVSEGLPSLVEPYLGAPDKTRPNPGAYVGSPRYPVNQPARGTAPASNQPARPAPAPQPAPMSQGPAAQPQVARPAATAQQVAQPAGTEQQATLPSHPIVDANTPAANPNSAAPAPAPLKASDKQSSNAAAVSPQQKKALEAAQKARAEQDRKDAKRRAEQAKKDEAQRKQAEKLNQERLKREAEVAQKNAEASRKQNDDEEKRQKALNDAALRLKQAQEAYQLEVAKSGSTNKGGGQ
jgi:pilus assembly protein CpaC